MARAFYLSRSPSPRVSWIEANTYTRRVVAADYNPKWLIALQFSFTTRVGMTESDPIINERRLVVTKLLKPSTGNGGLAGRYVSGVP